MNKLKQWYLKKTRFNISWLNEYFTQIHSISDNDGGIKTHYDAYDKNKEWLCSVPIKRDEKL